MNISESIAINIESVAREIYERQDAPWNGGIYFDNKRYTILNELFINMNRSREMHDFMYKGDIYRIHCQNVKFRECVVPWDEIVVGKVCDDGSCSVLPITQYNDMLSSFSSNHDFTRQCYYKIIPNQIAILFHANTGCRYGLDVNQFLNTYGYKNDRFAEEHEILFPMNKNYIIKEYICSPNQFNYYMRNK